MRRIEAIQRSKGHTVDGKEFLTYDIKHVWPNNLSRNGVLWGSTVHCYFQEPSKPADVSFWIPGVVDSDRRKLTWPNEIWFEVKEFGIASAVSWDNVPLDFFWELTAGKA